MEKRETVTLCLQCHDGAKNYVSSSHGKKVMAGNTPAASCVDCHGSHDIKRLAGATSNEVRKLKGEMCIKCHENAKIMEGAVSTSVVESYLESYHGKSYRLGFPQRTAICADCHSPHTVAPPSNPASSIHSANLVQTCSKCHQNATVLFTRYYSHGEHANRKDYPILYWTFIGMTMLLVSVFVVFWIHTLLWMIRGFVENREHALANEPTCSEVLALSGAGTAIPMAGAHAPAVAGAKIQYERFKTRHILLHFVVIVSFLGLSLTGLPLKFSDQAWAQTMMSFYGGVHYAGLIHRGCAILTFYYFIGAIIMSIDFLFIRKDIKGNWLQRLFGSDSLMPNFRDVRDITAMVRWFLFRGPKPTFDRWTYWEKFDFLAVFWGMFAIGGSGLMLWFPEAFSQVLPGWMFNVATIVHSDEALLATGFIFTVHFFNTHFRPEKFPMDFVIFNGQISKEEFIHERGDQWKRYQEDGIVEEFRVQRQSGPLYDFLFKAFGFSALFTGIALTILMFAAFIKG
jgi:cytochrome b subunit of formate dehydrogenase